MTQQYSAFFRLGNLAILNFAFECKAVTDWNEYKLCDITSANFGFTKDAYSLANDQNDDTAITIQCGPSRPKSVYLKTYGKAHTQTWYRGFMIVLCN